MDINISALRAGIRENLIDIDAQIQEVYKLADDLHTVPSRIKDEHGHFVLAPLLVAKAQMLHALTLIQKEK